MKAALLQLNSGDDPAANLPQTVALLREAVTAGAGFVLTPEATNCVSSSKSHQVNVLKPEAADPTLMALREEAARLGIWLSIGSLLLKTGDTDGRFANRHFVIGPDGMIKARYDKIHMFDVDVSPTETYRESATIRPGDSCVTVETPFATLGLAVCYDVRFPHLFRRMSQTGAEVLLVPAAFSPETGIAHWEPLLRARAIENGAYVLAAAQTGQHPSSSDRIRRTFGHSLAVSPWGEVLADAGEVPGITLVDLDREEVAKARGRVNSLAHDRAFTGP